jgi:hypothetical protein
VHSISHNTVESMHHDETDPSLLIILMSLWQSTSSIELPSIYIGTPFLQHIYIYIYIYIYMMTLPYDTLEWRLVMSVVMRHLWTRFCDGGGGGWKMRRFSLVDIDVYMQSSTYIIKSPLHIQHANK